MAQSLIAESHPRRQGSFKNKTSERSSPVPPKGTRQDENNYLAEDIVDKKSAEDQLAPEANPRIKVTGVSKEHIHSGLSARMLELSKPKGDSMPRRPKSPVLNKRISPLVEKKAKQTKSSGTQERSTSPRQGKVLKESPTMKLRKSSAEIPKPILKKSNSGAANRAHSPTQHSPRRKSQDQHRQPFANVEFGKSVRDTFRLKKRKKKTTDSDTYGAVDFDNALGNSESRSKSSKFHQSRSLKPFGGKLGLGHNFQLISLTNPSWCDHCGDFIWGLNKQCIKCSSECVCLVVCMILLCV